MKVKLLVSFFLMLFLQLQGFSQVSIQGPSCVAADLQYQYTISGNFDSASVMKICVEGGTITSGIANCQSGAPSSLIRVTWNAQQGSIKLSSSKGDTTLHVTLALSLEGGKIDSALMVQTIDSSSTPSSIICAAALGGGCGPAYQYQWQSSPDNMNWIDLPTAAYKDLSFGSALKESTYYRRKTLETSSNTIAYSNTALVILQPVIPGN